MKGMGGLLVMVAVVVGGLYFWTQSGGSVSGTAPEVDRPNVEAPSVNESASGLRRFFDWLGDEVMTWSSVVWQMIALGLVLLALRFVFKKMPMVVWMGIGAIGAIILVSVN